MEEILLNALAMVQHGSGGYSGENGVALLELDIETVIQEYEKLEHRIEVLESENDDLVDDVNDGRKEISEIEDKFDDLTDRFDDLNGEVMLCLTQELYTVDNEVCETYECLGCDGAKELVDNVKWEVNRLFRGDK